MSSLSSEVWRRLESDRIFGERLQVRIAAPNVSERLLAGLDASGKRHFLIALRGDEVPVQDTQSRGIQAVTRELTMAKDATATYIDVACLDPAGHDVFQIIGSELAVGLSENFNATTLVVNVLSKWRRFWGQLPRDMLSRSEQLGLFGELWFLQSWLFPIFGGAESVSRWRGPTGSRHDFEWPKHSVEVKVTTTVHGVIHNINGIDQLAPPENGTLFLFSLKLREEGGATNSLPNAIAECRRTLESNCDALAQFDARISQAGYAPAHEAEYSKMRLRVVEEALYTVVEAFPRITRDNLTYGVPAGVDAISYQVTLSGF